MEPSTDSIFIYRTGIMKKYYRIIRWYLRKHGLLRLTWLGFVRLCQNYIDNRDVMFYLDLEAEVCDGKDEEQELSVVSYKNINSIPREELSQLIQKKGEDILFPFFESFFRRGAVLWLGKMNETVVGYKWILTGGFEGFYTYPMTAKDAIFSAAEVLPQFRGRKINSRMTKVICAELRKKGISRVYWSVSIWNDSELKSSVKTNAKRIGIVRTYSIFGRWITIWSKKSLWQAKI